jgi:hypothetical protein
MRLTLPANPKSSSRAAFTIMEVALAATVLALTLMGMIEVIETGSRVLDLSRKQTLAEQIIRSELDQVRLQNWNTILLLPSTLTPLTTTGVAPTAAAPLYLDPAFPAYFSCQYQCLPVNDAGGTPVNNLVQITFYVSWTGMTGGTYTRIGTTYVGKNGLILSYQRS